MISSSIIDSLFLASECHIGRELLKDTPMLSEEAEDTRKHALNECLRVEQDCETELLELAKDRKNLADIKDRYCQDELKRAEVEQIKNEKLKKNSDEIDDVLKENNITIKDLKLRMEKIEENSYKRTELQQEIQDLKKQIESLKSTPLL